MYVVHATKKLRDRLGPPAGGGVIESSSTVLGSWYATAVHWKPQVALLVNETTLLPVLMPLAPSATLTDRFPSALALVLAAHGVGASFIDEELAQMNDVRVMPTNNRSVVGIMNEFIFLAEVTAKAPADLIDTALWLAGTPCSPLYKRHTSPDRELAALVGSVRRPV